MIGHRLNVRVEHYSTAEISHNKYTRQSAYCEENKMIQKERTRVFTENSLNRNKNA
jgi:hypothetical protein